MPLSEILKGSCDLSSTRQLTEAARQELTQVEDAIQKQQVHYINYDQSWQACVLNLLLQQFYSKTAHFLATPSHFTS